jgi:prolipoprotein diacylglyceryltransferase
VGLFGFITGWEFTGYQGLASHGAAISIIIAMYYFSKYYKTFTGF